VSRNGTPGQQRPFYVFPETLMPTQDTPGRPKSSSSRQQTQPEQGIQSGSPELDSKNTKVKYRDRPADEGKHGDAAEEPNPRNPK
jgi:hypothetical protein